MKEIRLNNRFSEKNYHLRKWAIFDPKIAHPHNSGSAGRTFLKFCTMKGANRQIKVILIIFQKSFVWGKWTILGPKIVHPHNSGCAVEFFFLNFAQ